MLLEDVYGEGRGQMNGHPFEAEDLGEGDGDRDRVTSNELARYLGDAILLAPSILLGPGTHWSTVDDAADAAISSLRTGSPDPVAVQKTVSALIDVSEGLKSTAPELVDALHQAGIGVIVDWVPAHFPKDSWALGRFDGTPLYEHADPRRGEQLDWGTYVFDFGRNEVRNFLVANALYWLEEFHVDGLRVDAVASMLYLDYSRPEGGWTPNVYGGRENLEAVQFLQEMNATVHKLVPGIVTVAEESTSWPGVTRPTNLGGLGFSMKWNMGWMNDTLDYISHDPVHRSFHHHEMTFSMLYAYSEHYVLPISHDEVVHGKGTLWTRMPGDDHAKAAGLRQLLAYQWSHPGKQLLFMGQEFGQRAEWSEERGLDWFQLGEHSFSTGVQQLVRDINAIYRDNRALWSRDSSPEGYSWIDANDSNNNVLSFLRFGDDGSAIACIFNFSGSEHAQYRLGLPHTGTWHELLNTDATVYNGAGAGNMGQVIARRFAAEGARVAVAGRNRAILDALADEVRGMAEGRARAVLLAHIRRYVGE